MRKLVAALILALGLMSPAFADPLEIATPQSPSVRGPVNDQNPLPCTYPSGTLTEGTSTNVSVGTTTATTINLVAPSMNVTITNTDSTNPVYFQPFGGAATTSNFPIPKGQTFNWACRQPLTQFSLIATGSSVVVGVLAH